MVNKVMQGYANPNRLRFKTDRETSRVKQCGETRLGLNYMGSMKTKKREATTKRHSKTMKPTPTKASSHRADWCRQRNDRLHQTPHSLSAGSHNKRLWGKTTLWVKTPPPCR